jgi:Flp pilus assembly protein TadG
MPHSPKSRGALIRSAALPSPSLRRTARRGATAVEFALTFPLLMVLLFGSLEFSRANMLVHTVTLAASEGARRGIVPGATAAECRTAAEAELAIVGVRNATVTVTPSVINESTTTVTVAISAPLDGTNSYLLSRFFLGKSVAKSVTLEREGS